MILSYTPTTEVKTDSYNIFDLAANWNINENITLRGGITNLFDEEPPRSGSSLGRPAGSNLAICDGAPGCQNPSGYSLPGVGGFNAGYYDTLGRRMFLGLKVTF